MRMKFEFICYDRGSDFTRSQRPRPRGVEQKRRQPTREVKSDHIVGGNTTTYENQSITKKESSEEGLNHAEHISW